MQKKQRATREPGNKTRAKIIRHAKKLFIKHGFAGTSMSMVAKAADINRSLIFHHFDSKQLLWQAVKMDFLSSGSVTFNTDLDNVAGNLEALLGLMVDSRLKFYDIHPDAFKLMCWQIVDANAHDLAPQSQTIEKLLPMIQQMQQQKQINSEHEPEVILMMLLSAAYAPLMLQHQLKLSQQQKERYASSMTDALYHILKPNTHIKTTKETKNA